MCSPDDTRPRSPGRGIGFGLRSPSALPRKRFVVGGVLALMSLGAMGFGGLVDASASPDEVGEASEMRAPEAELPVEMNPRVQYWMDRFMNQERRTFEAFMSRKGLYGDLIRDKLRDRGMPEELLYLAMIESGFQSGATSPVAAAGLWQFMGPTARQYGLRVDDWVDERRDPIRATDAALTYLAQLHERYGSWYLAAAAYNAGPGRVDRALRRQRERSAESDADLYWHIVDDLPRETREYVPRMLAVTLLARDTGAYGFDIRPHGSYAFDRVWVPGGTPLRVVARALDVPARELRDLNPHLVRGVTPPGASYGLRVPPGGVPQVVASLGGGRWDSHWADD